MSLRFSVLDQSPIPEGFAAGDALHNSIDLARLADRLGYHRYWVAEHHGSPGLACTSPEVLIGLIAAATTNIRVGSGGVMLPHYSPLKVAETFTMLSGLFPGRVDLGIGRAAGTAEDCIRSPARPAAAEPRRFFPDQLTELLAICSKLQEKPADVAASGLPTRARFGRRNSDCPTFSRTSSTPHGAPDRRVVSALFQA